MYYVNFDNAGNVIGFYTSKIHTNIPEPNIEITDEQHADYFQCGQCYKVIDGQWTYVEPELLPLGELKQFKLNELKKHVAPEVVYIKAPEYKQINSLKGIYDAATTETIWKWVEAVRQAVVEIEEKIAAAESPEELATIVFDMDSVKSRAEELAV